MDLPEESPHQLLQKIVLLQTVAMQNIDAELRQLQQLYIKRIGVNPLDGKAYQSSNEDIQVRLLEEKKSVVMSPLVRKIVTTMCTNKGGIKDPKRMIHFCEQLHKMRTVQDKLHCLFIVASSLAMVPGEKVKGNETAQMLNYFESGGGFTILAKWIDVYWKQTEELSQDLVHVILKILLRSVPRQPANRHVLLSEMRRCKDHLPRKDNQAIASVIVQNLEGISRMSQNYNA